ncbi:acyl-CoA/acyl-ACP dehydrogenase [Nocardia sp. NBC_00565]|uniref:acyl-CoA dehydrogenase family protein n=1 Tax=Nocardia sp. NBC_00565 TaxID=2975993 RepID=UPI002E81F166|nr:acyl-CoA dehydrogenase family protein [Nocardia sp. NBC_00565]WUC05692.1 acyl-CoA/acyl-ACP dehydrogenase [Nocardia sp. NBC_00565]
MNLLPSDDQLELVAAAAEFVRARMPIEDIRRRASDESSVDPAVWREGAELGLLTLGLAEEYGGAGQPFDDEALLFVELGRQLATGPFLAATLGARVAAHCGDSELSGRIGDGSAVVGLAELRGDGSAGADGFNGTFDLIDAAGCSYLLLITRQGAALVAASEFADVADLDSVDPATRLATATVTAGAVVHWLPDSADSIWLRAVLLSAAFLAGIADGATQLATEHAKTRVQFGSPIGVHQAIKHACSDMAVRTESAFAQVCFAAVCLASARPNTLAQVLAARAVAASAAVDNGAACIHVHGGMGYTYEHNAHLYLKRAHVYKHLIAEPSEVLAELLSQDVAA